MHQILSTTSCQKPKQLCLNNALHRLCKNFISKISYILRPDEYWLLSIDFVSEIARRNSNQSKTPQMGCNKSVKYKNIEFHLKRVPAQIQSLFFILFFISFVYSTNCFILTICWEKILRNLTFIEQ